MKELPHTVQIYLKKDDCYLLLYRNKKKNDVNEGKWIGVGGHVEKGESIDQAAIREVKEETGLDVHSLTCNGEVLFVNNDYQELMYVYEIEDFSGELIDCNEGELRWIPISTMLELPMWEGDKYYLPLLGKKDSYFKLEIKYRDKELVSVTPYL